MDNEQPKLIDFLLEFREFKGTVNTKLDRAIDDINNIKTNTVGRIETLEQDHVSRKEFETLQNWRYYLAGAIAIIAVVFTVFFVPEYKASSQEHKDLDGRLQTIENKLDIKN